VTSGQALAAQLTADRDCSGLYIAASPALREVLLDAGLIESDRPSHVVAGIDEDMPISRLSRALQHLNDGARLVASNADPAVPTATGLAPEAGAVVAFLERASGQTAQVAGKPNPAIFELALARLRLDARDVLMIGDTLDTDILGANRAGIRSVLVRSGNPPDSDSHAIPDFSLDDLASLREHLGL
ncbi:MAG: HAD-IA family hydrolase, partial [Gammaproteobacteria bacterium]|nr:HAD-IA family hydrolase [Gammaproteobacteria bacterium]